RPAPERRGVALAAVAVVLDLDAGLEELLGAEADGEVLAAEQSGRRALAAERVGGEEHRRGVPRRVVGGEVLAGTVEDLAVEVHAAPVGAVVVAQELDPAEQLVRV